MQALIILRWVYASDFDNLARLDATDRYPWLPPVPQMRLDGGRVVTRDRLVQDDTTLALPRRHLGCR